MQLAPFHHCRRSFLPRLCHASPSRLWCVTPMMMDVAQNEQPCSSRRLGIRFRIKVGLRFDLGSGSDLGL